MPTVKYLNSDKDFNSAVLAKLKILGVKVPKHKRVKSTNLKVEKSDLDLGHKIFGVRLNEQEWISDGESNLPKFLTVATAYLQKFSSKEIGLFRKAGNVARQKKLRAKLEKGETLEDSEPNDVASLLKQWLRELPEPLVSASIQEILMRCLQLETEENKITACLLSCLLLQPDHIHCLKHLLCFLADIAFKSDKNKMDAHNLALIMAPNIFVSCESSDKMKNNLFQQQTCVMKILIENCDKVGEIPDSITLQQLCPSSELDSSSDVLDSLPTKSRKKHKNDILSGIRKLVGQNGTPNSKNETPEQLIKTPSDSKSSSKRKADLELNSLSTTKNKKPAHSMENLNNPLSSLTPKKKANDVDKSTCGHVRRKSIGALLRRKRGKSSKVPQIKLHVEEDSSGKSSSFDISDKHKDVQNLNICSDTFDFKKEHDFKSSPINFKKSVSDCQLPVVDIEFSKQPALVVSSSQGCLPKQPLKTSPHSLRSQKFSGSQIGEATVLDSDHRENVEIKKKQKSSRGNVIFSDIENKLGGTLVTFSKSHNYSNTMKNDKNQEFIEEFMNSKRKSPLLSLPILNPMVYNDASTPKFIIKIENESAVLNDFIPKATDPQNYSLKRQEAFIVKSIKASPSITGSRIKSFDYDTPEHQSKNQSIKGNSKLASIQQNNKGNRSQRKSLKRKTRHGSLIRGRPNAVNNGLQSTTPHRCFNDCSIISSSSPNLSTREDIFTYDDSKFLKSPVLQSLDLSLNALLQGICLFSPSDSSNAAFSRATSHDENRFTPKTNTSPTEKDNNLDHSLVEFDSIPSLGSQKNFLLCSDDEAKCFERSRVDSTNQLDFSQNVLKAEYAGTERSKGDEIIDMNENHSPACSSGKQELNDSCFRTPNNIHSPDSINWMSGSTFFNNLSPPSAEAFNKRESIAMILKNKTGHVQAKVDLYDNQLHKSSSCSAKKHKYQDEKLMRASPQKCYSTGKVVKDSKIKSFGSENRNNSVKSRGKFQMSPLPPPPKFTLTDLSTPPSKISHPLKELTNVSLSADDLKTNMSPNNSKRSNTPIKYTESPLLSKEIPNSGPKIKKLKRSSFSGQTPRTLRNKVSRSESSPACHRKIIILHE